MNAELEKARSELEYLRRTAEQTIARMLRLDASSLALRHELEQKRRGFALMAELAANLGRKSDYRSIFISVGRRINAALHMQRTVVLRTDEQGMFRAVVLQGYSAEEKSRILSRPIEVDEELLNPEKPVFVTGADPEERLASFRKQLALPYFVASPIILHDAVEALLVTGRLVEQIPFFTRLGRGDVETVRTVSAYLAAMLAGQRLVEAEERTRLMLDSMPLGCNFWDEQGNIIDCNQEAVRLFDFSDKKEYLERFCSLSPSVQPDGRPSRERELELIKHTFSTGFARSTWMYLKPDGKEEIPAELTFIRVQHRDSFHVLAYIRDLREVKTVLAEIRQTEDALRHARELAEKNGRDRSAFLANMNHELHTPMNGILGMIRLLSESGLTEQQREFMDKAEYSARLLLSIIDDILDFSAIEAGHFRLAHTEFSLRETVERALEATREKARVKKLTFSLSIAPDAPRLLLGDPARLGQVLFNLADNAVKFTEKGGVEIRIAGLPGRSGGEGVHLFCEVSDTGIGVDDEQATKLFSAFTQADESTSRRYGGTGLGLAICSRIVKMMDGAIRCSGQIGRGSTFSFEAVFGLPESPSVVPDDSSVDGQAKDETKAPFAALCGLRVLLAEDNEINRMIAVELLAERGVVTDTVVNGREAVETLTHTAYDVVLMDIQMPEMDGLTAAKLIRADPKFKSLPILAMTAHATDKDRELSRLAGMNEHLTKPIVPDLLFAALLRWGRAEAA